MASLCEAHGIECAQQAVGPFHTANSETIMSLISLPDHCLLSVLQFVAVDLASLFSAARAHSRLHHAAAPVLTSIRAHIMPSQKDSLLLYISNHHQHINRIAVTGFGVELFELPADLRISSLSLEGAMVQLHAGNGCQGVLASSTALQALQLHECELTQGTADLAAALPLLPGLQHLEVVRCRQSAKRDSLYFPGAILRYMQQLTSLNFGEIPRPDMHPSGCVVHHLHHLTNLESVRLTAASSAYHMCLDPNQVVLTAELLSGLTRLSSLQLSRLAVHPAILVGKGRLQHLSLKSVLLASFAQMDFTPSTAVLLSELQLLQELTCLCLASSLGVVVSSIAAYSALTASTKLQHLDISGCTFPMGGIWEHVIPSGRQLPHMRALITSGASVRIPSELNAREAKLEASDAKRLVTCCPNLQQLTAEDTLHPAEVLQPLVGLTGLRSLVVSKQDDDALDVLKDLSSLRRLEIVGGDNTFTDWGLLQLTALRQLTHLKVVGSRQGVQQFKDKGPWSTPVWQQVLQHCKNSRMRTVAQLAQHAAAALAL